MTAAEQQADVEIRSAERADLLDVFRIEKQSFSQPWPYAAFEQFLDSEGFLIAEDGTVVGYIIADRTDEYGVPVGHIKDIAVTPDRRHEGIGRTLLSYGLTTLGSSGIGQVKLEVRPSNHGARSMYEAFGFELHHVRQSYYEDGEDAHVMVRKI